MASSSPVPYLMPDVASLPDSGVAWRIEPHRAVLLVQHMQKYVLQALRDTSPIGELLANIGRLVYSARTSGVPVLYVTRVPGQATTRADGLSSNPSATAPSQLSADAHAFAEVLQPQAGDMVLAAKRYSAFVGTRLGWCMRELGRDQLVVVGAVARTDVLLTAADAWMRDLQPAVVADAVADRTAADHAMAVNWLTAACPMVTGTETVVAAFRGGSPGAVAV